MMKAENLYRRKMVIHYFIEGVADDDLEEVLCATVTRLSTRANGQKENEVLKLEIATDLLLQAGALLREVMDVEEAKAKTQGTKKTKRANQRAQNAPTDNPNCKDVAKVLELPRDAAG